MIYILYRDTSNPTGLTKNRPSWFSAEKCLESMLRSIEGKEYCQLHMLFDGDNPPTDDRIHTTKTFKGGSDWASYNFTWRYARDLNIGDDDVLFLAENDYMYLPNWPEAVLELYGTYLGLDYVSLYDHPDKYNYRVYPSLTCNIYITKNYHWRTTPSTTGSLIFKKRILEEDFDLFMSNPSDFGRFEILRETKQRSVLSPIPSLSTHCEVEYLAPIIKWENI
jgi:hypothetical protein